MKTPKVFSLDLRLAFLNIVFPLISVLLSPPLLLFFHSPPPSPSPFPDFNKLIFRGQSRNLKVPSSLLHFWMIIINCSSSGFRDWPQMAITLFLPPHVFWIRCGGLFCTRTSYQLSPPPFWWKWIIQRPGAYIALNLRVRGFQINEKLRFRLFGRPPSLLPPSRWDFGCIPMPGSSSPLFSHSSSLHPFLGTFWGILDEIESARCQCTGGFSIVHD